MTGEDQKPSGRRVSLKTAGAEYWKRKLAAYLHDPPSKCLDIASHGLRSGEAMRRAGFSEEEIGKYAKVADHTAAAADRFPFPGSRVSGLSCHFDGVRNGFIHPLAGRNAATLNFHRELEGIGAIEGDGGEVQPCWQTDTQPFNNAAEEWRARFFLHWRLWPQLAAEKDYRWKFLPADTRMPDHSIWTHMGVVSALASCDEDAHAPLSEWRKGTKLKAAFLKFQIGPVQDFIAAARSTRDLWSGSYLLGWLMAAGLEEIALRIGPDAVIFPNLHGQPLIDFRLKETLWDKIKLDCGRGKGKTAWDAYLAHNKEELLTPNLPNVFLAIVPADQAEELARHVEITIRKEWKKICKAVWDACDGAGLMDESTLSGLTREQRKARFDRQLEQHLSVSWQVTPWPETVADAQALCKSVPEPENEKDADGNSVATLSQRFEAVLDAATKHMPDGHRDSRYYTDEAKTQLNNVGIAWPLMFALNGWALDATRQVRDFSAWSSGGWDVGVKSNKDSLTGKEEAVAGGGKWLDRCDTLAKGDRKWRRFKKDDWLGAVTLVKRLWDLVYLREDWNLKDFPMPNTRGLARHEPFSNEDNESAVEDLSGENYFAVLAFDGDSIGQWVSGAKTPIYRDILADYTDGGGAQRHGALEYFERGDFAGFLETRRLLSPSYHLQFSDALSSFALKCAASVVEAYDGRLIYAGGDDVLAMLPADAAIACAKDLVRAFQGKAPARSGRRDFSGQPRSGSGLTDKLNDANTLPEGFLAADTRVRQDSGEFSIPFVVPGPSATASVGIAVAHFKSPLQDVVRAAQVAEKRAKRGLHRDALAVTLLKRSGEIIEWGCKWKSGGIELFDALLEARREKQMSSRFPYRLVQLLEPYVCPVRKTGELSDVSTFDVVDVVSREIGFALGQHCQSKDIARNLAELFQKYVNVVKEAASSATGKAATNPASRLIEHVIGLCQTFAFIQRNIPSDKDATNKSKEDAA